MAGKNGEKRKPKMPSVEQIQEALSKAESPDDFFGKDGIFAELFSDTKTKSSFPTSEAARKLLYLATVNITSQWARSIRHWPKILNQLAIRFEDRIST